jgi:hypothetical protein
LEDVQDGLDDLNVSQAIFTKADLHWLFAAPEATQMLGFLLTTPIRTECGAIDTTGFP